MSKSIISNEPECLVCKTTLDLHKHHVFGGNGRRKVSEEYGCWVYLCARHHNMSKAGVHFNKTLDTKLKQECQRAWEARYGDRAVFIRTFGRSYL